MTLSKDTLSQLKNSTWITSGARFNAELRLRKQNTAQLWSIALLSAIAICVNIAPLYTHPNDQVPFGSICNFISTVISIVITSLSFYTANSSGIKHADMLHQCAKSIKSLNKDICECIENNTPDKYNEFKHRYDIAMDACPINHELCDYMLFCAQNLHDSVITNKHPNIQKWAILHKIHHFASCYSPYIVFIVLLIILTAVTCNLPFSQPSCNY